MRPGGGNGETILLAEDDDALRQLVARILRAAGYKVLEAADGEAALTCSANHGRVDLLVTDMVMPKLDGVALATALCARDVHLPVLYMSGYPDGVIRKRSELGPEASWIAKPFAATALLEQVRNRLKKST